MAQQETVALANNARALALAKVELDEAIDAFEDSLRDAKVITTAKVEIPDGGWLHWGYVGNGWVLRVLHSREEEPRWLTQQSYTTKLKAVGVFSELVKAILEIQVTESLKLLRGTAKVKAAQKLIKPHDEAFPGPCRPPFEGEEL